MRPVRLDGRSPSELYQMALNIQSYNWRDLAKHPMSSSNTLTCLMHKTEFGIPPMMRYGTGETESSPYVPGEDSTQLSLWRSLTENPKLPEENLTWIAKQILDGYQISTASEAIKIKDLITIAENHVLRNIAHHQNASSEIKEFLAWYNPAAPKTNERSSYFSEGNKLPKLPVKPIRQVVRYGPQGLPSQPGGKPEPLR